MADLKELRFADRVIKFKYPSQYAVTFSKWATEPSRGQWIISEAEIQDLEKEVEVEQTEE